MPTICAKAYMIIGKWQYVPFLRAHNWKQMKKVYPLFVPAIKFIG